LRASVTANERAKRVSEWGSLAIRPRAETQPILPPPRPLKARGLIRSPPRATRCRSRRDCLSSPDARARGRGSASMFVLAPHRSLRLVVALRRSSHAPLAPPQERGPRRTVPCAGSRKRRQPALSMICSAQTRSRAPEVVLLTSPQRVRVRERDSGRGSERAATRLPSPPRVRASTRVVGGMVGDVERE